MLDFACSNTISTQASNIYLNQSQYGQFAEVYMLLEVLSLEIRDGNRTEPEPNTPNSNLTLWPFRTEPNEPKEFDSRTRTEPNYQIERTEPNRTRASESDSCATVLP